MIEDSKLNTLTELKRNFAQRNDPRSDSEKIVELEKKLDTVVDQTIEVLNKLFPGWNNTEDLSILLTGIGFLFVVRENGGGQASLQEQLDNYINVIMNPEYSKILLHYYTKIQQDIDEGRVEGFRAPNIPVLSEYFDCKLVTFVLGRILQRMGLLDLFVYFIDDPTHPRLLLKKDGKNVDISAEAPRTSSATLGCAVIDREVSDDVLNRQLERGRPSQELWAERIGWEHWPLPFDIQTMLDWEKFWFYDMGQNSLTDLGLQQTVDEKGEIVIKIPHVPFKTPPSSVKDE